MFTGGDKKNRVRANSITEKFRGLSISEPTTNHNRIARNVQRAIQMSNHAYHYSDLPAGGCISITRLASPYHLFHTPVDDHFCLRNTELPHIDA